MRRSSTKRRLSRTYLIDTYSAGWLLKAPDVETARRKAARMHGKHFWGGYQVLRVPKREMSWHEGKTYLS